MNQQPKKFDPAHGVITTRQRPEFVCPGWWNANYVPLKKTK